MSTESIAAFVSLGVVILGAYLGAFAWLVSYINKIVEKQNTYRHDATDRMVSVISEVEERLSRRIERIEDLWRR